MNLERVGFRFTAGELAVMAENAGLQLPKEFPKVTGANKEHAMEQLKANRVVESVGNELICDRVVLMILVSVCAAADCCGFVSDTGIENVLYFGKRFCVMAEKQGEMYCLTPLQTSDEGLKMLLENANRRSATGKLFRSGTDKNVTVEELCEWVSQL